MHIILTKRSREKSLKSKCDKCGKELPEDTEQILDPCLKEICDEEVLVYLCDECYNEHLADI